MSLDATISMDSAVSTPIEDTKLVEKPRKRPRPELLKQGNLVLTRKLDIGTHVQLSIDALFGKFEKITHPHIQEHLLGEEEAYFKEKIDIEKLPVGGIVEVWAQTPDSEEYTVTEYKKLK